MPHNTDPSSTGPTRPPTTAGPRTGPAGSGAASLIGESTTFQADVEALHATADKLTTLRLPTPVALPSAGATGDEVLDAVLGAFCRRYNQLIEDTAADHSAAIGHLRGTATDYATTEAAITRSLLGGVVVPTTTTSERTTSERSTPEAPRSARA